MDIAIILLEIRINIDILNNINIQLKFEWYMIGICKKSEHSITDFDKFRVNELNIFQSICVHYCPCLTVQTLPNIRV